MPILVSLQAAIVAGRIVWQRHALVRMLERGISRNHVVTSLAAGEVIEVYGDDKPLPSLLVLGFFAGEPLHVVTAYDEVEDTAYIITVYRPDRDHFANDFKTRRNP